MARRRRTRRTIPPVAAWITREFAVRGLAPPHCTPEALARALEREGQITIALRPHASEDPGVYGLLYRPAERDDTYVILYRPTRSITLYRLILFHELAHILFHHALTEVPGVGALRGYMVSDRDDAIAEAFAVGAMQYSFLDPEAPRQRMDGEGDGPPSAFGQLLQQAEGWL
jgi:hypothetical protein